MIPILALGAVLYGPQLIERLRKPGAPGATPDLVADLFLWHIRSAGEALGAAQRGGGLVAVGVARGHIEGARKVFAQLPAPRRSEGASAIQRAQELAQRIQAELVRPVEVAASNEASSAPDAGAAPNVLQYAPR